MHGLAAPPVMAGPLAATMAGPPAAIVTGLPAGTLAGPPAAAMVDRSGEAEGRLVAELLAIDPAGLGGAVLRGPPGRERDAWMAGLRHLLPAEAPFRRVPSHVGDDRLLGGLDLAATLRAGRPVGERGLLAEADRGLLVVGMAERLAPDFTSRITASLDTGEVRSERDGLAFAAPARLAVLLLDEGLDEAERAPAALRDRLAFELRVGPTATSAARERAAATRAALAARGAAQPSPDPSRSAVVAAARVAYPGVAIDAELVAALCETAAALGIGSARPAILAAKVARASAALSGAPIVRMEDAAVAARLVLAPRAVRLPSTDDAPGQPPPEPPDPSAQEPASEPPPVEDEPASEPPPGGDEPGRADEVEVAQAGEILLAAAAAAIPPGLLARLGDAASVERRASAGGRVGPARAASGRGRPGSVQRGLPRGGRRLDLIETLRAAAPWQALRARPASGVVRPDRDPPRPRLQVRASDLRVRRRVRPAGTTTVFAVDASGSAALQRLAEAKGAVELLLAECYVRRDEVALLAFRGTAADLLLPPTRSLVRAKRCLAALPGGGGTPLAAGLDAALAVSEKARRRGSTPIVVLLTDGRANIARDGKPGRDRAMAEAEGAARHLRAAGLAALLVDIAPRAQATARALAEVMGATYLPLPQADARTLDGAVRAVVTRSGTAPSGRSRS